MWGMWGTNVRNAYERHCELSQPLVWRSVSVLNTFRVVSLVQKGAGCWGEGCLLCITCYMDNTCCCWGPRGWVHLIFHSKSERTARINDTDLCFSGVGCVVLLCLRVTSVRGDSSSAITPLLLREPDSIAKWFVLPPKNWVPKERRCTVSVFCGNANARWSVGHSIYISSGFIGITSHGTNWHLVEEGRVNRPVPRRLSQWEGKAKGMFLVSSQGISCPHLVLADTLYFCCLNLGSMWYWCLCVLVLFGWFSLSEEPHYLSFLRSMFCVIL